MTDGHATPDRVWLIWDRLVWRFVDAVTDYGYRRGAKQAYQVKRERAERRATRS